MSQILLLFFVSLSFLPLAKGMMSGHCASESHPSHETNDQHEHEEEHCPVSCYCSCCTISFVYNIKEPSTQEAKLEIPHKASFNYQSRLGILFEYDIWQPPRF